MPAHRQNTVGCLKLGSFIFSFACAASAFAAPSTDTTKDLSEADAAMLGAVAVTASKTGTSLKDISTSTVVMSGSELEQRGIRSSTEVLAHIANVTSSGPGNLAPAVRGIDGTGSATGVDAFLAGSRARLGVQMDGRPASYNEIVFGSSSLWDVQQVEMLRGPQSTLQGRNAMAGTLVIKTRDPSWSPVGAVRVMGGNHMRRQLAFFLSGPVSDSIALRLSADYQAYQSEVNFQPYPTMSDPGQFESRMIRGKLLYAPLNYPGLRELVTFQHSRTRGPQTSTEARPFGSHQAATPQMPVFEPTTDSLISETSWDIGKRMTLENVASFTKLDIRRYALVHTGQARIHNYQYMIEPRIRWNRGGGIFKGVVGIHLYRTLQDEYLDVPADENFTDRVDTYAVYGEGSWALDHHWELTFGLRYQYERHRRNGGDPVFFDIDIDESDAVFLPKLDLAWHPDKNWTLGVSASRGYNGGGGGITFGAPIVNYRFKPEYVHNYETYFRGELLQGRLNWSGNLFYGDYRDMQLPFDLNPDPAVFSTVIRNAPRAHNYGVETAVHWKLGHGVEARGNLGLLKTEVTQYPGSGIEGHSFARAPNVTGGFGLHWQGTRGFDFGLGTRYSDGYWSSFEHKPRGHTQGYWMVDMRGGYRFHGVRVFVFVKNLLDEDTPLLLAPGAIRAQDIATLPESRHFGLGVQWDFQL